MKINWLLLMVLPAAAALFSAPAFGQRGPVCSPPMVAGTYTVTCSGWTAAGPGGALVPVMQVGTAFGDEDGNWSGSTVVNIGGQVIIPDAKVSGKAIVNSDCTGSVTYNKGTPSELNISFVVNPRTQETHGLVVDKGSVISCVLKRNAK
jgi:hypothetical protein